MILDKKPSRFAYRCIRAAGDAIAARRKQAGNRLCILSYHRILEENDPILLSEPDIQSFQWQMELLAECFNVMPLYDATMALAKNELPPRAVCITFDDGYRSIHDFALPILKTYRLPSTVFVTSGCLGVCNMWNDRIIEAVRSLPGGQVDLRLLGMGKISLAGDQAKKRLAHQLIESSKYLYPQARLELAEQVEKIAGGARRRDLMLTPEMVSRLSDQNVEIGGHTISHPILTRVDDVVASREIHENKRHLEQIAGKPVRLFAYPNGKPHIDFGARHVEMVKDAGYLAAFTTLAGAAERTHDMYQLPRSRPWDTNPLMYGARLLRWLQG